MARLADELSLARGLTAFVGGGGKTTLMLHLARELSECGTVIVTTSTHIFPPDGIRTLYAPIGEAELQTALVRERLVCIGTPCENGKLSDAGIPYRRLKALADFVLVEADGAKGHPLKANRAHEPVIPAEADRVIAVAGMSCAGETIETACFNAALYAGIVGKSVTERVAPEDVSRVLTDVDGQRKGVPQGAAFSVVLTMVNTEQRRVFASGVQRELSLRGMKNVFLFNVK